MTGSEKQSIYSSAEKLQPAFSENNIPVVFATDDNYVPYLSVALQSLVANSAAGNNYDILILNSGLTSKNQQILLSFNKKNISVRFINILEYVNGDIFKNFFLRLHFSVATYYRIFIPTIFSHYKKILYLDCDIVVLTDVDKLYHTDLKDKVIAAAIDVEIQRELNHQPDSFLRHYFDHTLCLKNKDNYFQAGVMLCDIHKLQQFDFTEKCLNLLQKIKKPFYVDQDILNCVLDGLVLNLDLSWNLEWHLPIFTPRFKQEIPDYLYQQYTVAYNAPKIIHFTSNIKPWISDKPKLSKYFWFYAKQTVFYHQIHQNLIHQKLEILRLFNKYTALRIRHLLYKLFSCFSFGQLNQKYKKKSKKIKPILKKTKRILKLYI